MMETKREKSKILMVVLALLILLLPITQLAAAGGQESTGTGEVKRKVITLRFTAGHPYAAAAWVQVLQDFYMAEVSKRVLEETKDYELNCQGFFGGSLAKLGEVLEAVESGTADIGLVNNVFEQAKLEIHNFNWWPPFTSPDLSKVIKANAKVMDENPIFDQIFAKYNQRQLGRAFNSASSFELVTNFPVTKLEDLKGKKIAHGGSMIPWLQALGAVGVQSTFTDAYTSIDTGVYQGWAMSLDVATTFKVHEVAKYITLVGFGSFVNGYLTINLDTWKSLPPEVQKILDEVGYEYTQKLYELNMANLEKSRSIMQAAGCTITELSAAEKQRWAKILSDAGVAKVVAQKADNNGTPGTQVLKAYIKALEDAGYSFPFRPEL